MTVRLQNGRWMAEDEASGRAFVADTEAQSLELMGRWRQAGCPPPSNLKELSGRKRTKRTA